MKRKVGKTKAKPKTVKPKISRPVKNRRADKIKLAPILEPVKEPKTVKSKIEKSIERLNAFRSPEAVAKLILLKDNRFDVEFKGPFCRTCGMYDYFEDLNFELEHMGLKSEVKDVKEIENGAVVSFELIELK